MIKTLFAISSLLLFVAFNTAVAQTFKEQFDHLVSKNDTLGQKQLLEKWEKEAGNDPELYASAFNYYINKSFQEVIRLTKNQEGKEELAIIEQDSSNKEPVGFLSTEAFYEFGSLDEGFKYISRGIEKYPKRLDMRFGKIYMYGKLEDYEKFTNEILKTIDYSAVINNNWLWSGNSALEKPKEMMLSSIQDYVLQLYNTGDDALLVNMKQIAEAVLKHYPDHVESLSNLSIVYLLTKEYDSALQVLLKAEKLAPNDYIILGNIAQAYKLKGDKALAIKYYEQTLKYGDEQTKKYAKEQIEQLKL